MDIYLYREKGMVTLRRTDRLLHCRKDWYRRAPWSIGLDDTKRFWREERMRSGLQTLLRPYLLFAFSPQQEGSDDDASQRNVERWRRWLTSAPLERAPRYLKADAVVAGKILQIKFLRFFFLFIKVSSQRLLYIWLRYDYKGSIV